MVPCQELKKVLAQIRSELNSREAETKFIMNAVHQKKKGGTKSLDLTKPYFKDLIERYEETWAQLNFMILKKVMAKFA